LLAKFGQLVIELTLQYFEPI